ncbi:MAG: HAD-IA family hydrolase [Gammaproteobacteria bacterium]|nr:HAD-IA family hydrolase [Gammaproteobacteria bacterium]
MSNTPNLPYRALIFDWDGTLMDSESRIVNCLRKACADVIGKEERTDNELKDVIGLGLREALLRLYPGQGDELIETMAESYRNHYLYHDETPSELFDGVEALLESLENQGYWLAIATGKGRQGLDQVLEYTGLTDRFHVTRCASETFSKPHPLMLEEILDKLGIDARDALMIGDTEYDMEMALNADMDRLAVSYGVHSQSRLLKHKPIGCLHDICELPAYLNQLHQDN